MTTNAKETDKNRKTIWKIGTWNTRSLQGKEEELEEEFEQAKLDILTVTETKKKGAGFIKMKKGHIMIYSGVDKSKRAKAGVACIIHKKIEQEIEDWKAWSERILTVKLKSQQVQRTIITVYGPNEDEAVDIKEKFWTQLHEVTDEAKGDIYIAGDFNSRVGKKDNIYNKVIGKFGEEKRNDNGKRMLDFCTIQNMIITNTFFNHKDIHKYTRVEENRNEKSIIDYILVQKLKRNTVINTKTRRGPEIGSDHHMVVTKIRTKAKETIAKVRETKDKI